MTFPSVTSTNTSGSRISENGFYLKQALRHNNGEDKPESEYTTGPRFSRSGEPYVNASESLQALLHLDHPRVLLNHTDHLETFQAVPTTTATLYNENIPVEHRIYLEATREELLKKYVKFIKGFKTAVFPLDRMTPYDRTSRDILHALNLTPGRDKDVVFLRDAFVKLHDFFLEYNHAMREAVASHPQLRSKLRKVGSASVQRVIALVLAGKEIEHEPLEAGPMILSAQAAGKIAAQHDLRKESRDFYARPDCVVGAGSNALRSEIHELAAGRVGYRDLASLLRYGPTGELHTTIARSRHTNKTEGGFGQWVDVTHSVTYKNPLIRHLYYLENSDTPDQKAITVLMGKDGFLPKGTLVPLPFINPPSNIVRQDNEDMLSALILNAQQNMNQ